AIQQIADLGRVHTAHGQVPPLVLVFFLSLDQVDGGGGIVEGRNRTVIRFREIPPPPQFRQKFGLSSTSTVNSSSRPISMPSDSTHFASSSRGA
ncbi:MAG: hypothetical protein RLY86_3490, partial [Pseudomonadota bacterium]